MSMILNSFISFPASAGFSPSDISNFKAWFDATDVWDGTEPSNDDDIGDSGEEWQDLSGNGNHLGQLTAIARPKYKTNIQNSLPAIYFSGSNLLKNVLADQDQPVTVCMVFKNLAPNTAHYFFDTDQSGDYWHRCPVYTNDTSGDLKMSAGSAKDTTYDLDSNTHCAIFSFNESSSECWIDGTQYGGTLDVGTAQWADFILGARYSNNTYYQGYFFEICIYYKTLSTGERQSIETYFTDKWGIS